MNQKLKSIFKNNLVAPRYLKGPYTIEIDPTNNCPLKCKYCFWDGMVKGERASLNEAAFHKLIVDLINIKVKGIIFTGGGEPLNHSYTATAINRAKAGGIHVGLFTNGVLLDRNITSSILPNLSWVRFNLSAADRESYRQIHGLDVFEEVINNIQNCVSFKKDKNLHSRVGIGCILNHKFININMIKQLIELTEKIGLDFIQFKHDLKDMQKVSYDNWWKLVVIPELKRYSRIIKKVSIEYSESTYLNRQAEPCFIAREIAIVKADGSVCLCKLHRDNPSMMIGNIYSQSFSNIWFGNIRTKKLEVLEKRGCDICCQYHDINRYINEEIRNNRKQNYSDNNLNYNDNLAKFGENIYFL